MRCTAAKREIRLPARLPARPVQNTSKREVAWMFWIVLVLLLASRAAFVVPITLAHNRFCEQKLSMREMGTIWWAGLMRGAVSGALPGHVDVLPAWQAGHGACRRCGACAWQRKPAHGRKLGLHPAAQRLPPLPTPLHCPPTWALPSVPARSGAGLLLLRPTRPD